MANPLASYSTDAVYRARKYVTIDGVNLKPGELLPSDSPLRKDSRRLELMCQTRHLMPGTADDQGANKKKKAEPTATSSATSVPEPVPVIEEAEPSTPLIPLVDPVADSTINVTKPIAVPKPKKSVVKKVVVKPAIDVDELSKSQLISKLEDLGLKTTGGKEQLVERLRIALS